MAWVVWLALSGLCVSASYVTSVAVYPDRGVLDRMIAAFLVSTSMVLVAIHTCGLLDRLSPWPLGLFSLALFSAVGFASLRAAGRHRLVACARRDALSPWRLAREAWALREPAVGTFVPAALA